jgi:F-type H+-transporting ATPase subunit delta
MAEAELATIARPYARAAFSYALDQDSGLTGWSRMLQLLSAAVNEDVVRVALDNPLLSGDDEAGLLISLLGEEMSTECQNFVYVLAGYDRVALLPEIADMYELLKANHEKTMEVEVTSAFEISTSEITALSTALKAKLQREINLESTVDKSLLGGIVIKAEDTVIDDSVRGKLQKMANELS